MSGRSGFCFPNRKNDFEYRHPLRYSVSEASPRCQREVGRIARGIGVRVLIAVVRTGSGLSLPTKVWGFDSPRPLPWVFQAPLQEDI